MEVEARLCRTEVQIGGEGIEIVNDKTFKRLCCEGVQIGWEGQ